MLQTEKFNHTLKLSILFSFFLFQLSWLVLYLAIPIQDLIVNTFLANMNQIIDIIVISIITIIKYVSLVFLIGCVVTLFITFIMDYLLNMFKK